MFVARLDERTIISFARNSTLAVFPRRAAVGASDSSRPIENGEPSARLRNSFFTGSSSVKVSVPASTRRSTSRRTGVFIVDAACMTREGFRESESPVDRSLNQAPNFAPLPAASLRERGPKHRHLRRVEARPGALLIIRRNLLSFFRQSPRVAKERLQERAVERRDLDDRDVVAGRLEDGPVADPHRLVVDPLLRAEEEEVAGEEGVERHGNEAGILERLLVAVSLQQHAVLREDPLHQAGAVEPERRRPAPGIRRAEEALPERNPIGRGTKRGIFFEGEEGDVSCGDESLSAIRQRDSDPRVGISPFTF